MKNDPHDELLDTLAGRLTEHLTSAGYSVPDLLVRDSLEAITADWSVTRNRDIVRDDAGYQDGTDVCRESVGTVREGSVLEITTPWRPETGDERTEREARAAAFSWAWRARQFSYDPQDLGYDGGECPPPPERVGILQLLDQGLWWRARMEIGSDVTTAIRLEDMTHSHRLALLAFLRRNAPSYKLREDWRYASTPGPNGDMASDAFEAECARQWDTSAADWIEDQPLVAALVYWTTPVAESPLTWRPMNEAPDDRPVVARLAGHPEIQVEIFYNEWCQNTGGSIVSPPPWFERPGVEWRELRDDELPTPVDDPRDLSCEHGSDEHCSDCCGCGLTEGQCGYCNEN